MHDLDLDVAGRRGRQEGVERPQQPVERSGRRRPAAVRLPAVRGLLPRVSATWRVRSKQGLFRNGISRQNRWESASVPGGFTLLIVNSWVWFCDEFVRKIANEYM